MESRTWSENADEYRALTRQGKDVRLALLVACSVEKGKRGGDRKSKEARSNPDRGLIGKGNAEAFAKKAGTSGDRVLRHLAAWDVFAAETGYPLAAELAPSDAVGLDITEAHAAVWDDLSFEKLADEGVIPRSGSRPRSTIKEITDKAAEDPDYAARLAAGLAQVAPEAVANQVEDDGVAAAVANNIEASGAVVRAMNAKPAGTGKRKGGDSAFGDLADGFDKLIISIGVKLWSEGGRRMYDTLVKRQQELPLRPREIEAVVAAIDDGLRYGADCKALLTPVGDTVPSEWA